MNLTKKIKEIRKFARFGLIVFSNHAIKRSQERGLTQKMIIDMLCDKDNCIAQYQEHYRGAEYSSYVIWAQSSFNKKFYHIVVYDEISQYGGHLYKVSTVYEPSSQLFTHHGRYVKKRCDRHLLR